MLLLSSLLATGCKNDPLYDDMKIFCRAADVTNGKTVVAIGPYVADRAKTDDLKRLLASVADVSTNLDSFLAGATELAKRANVDPCPTIAVLKANDPRRADSR